MTAYCLIHGSGQGPEGWKLVADELDNYLRWSKSQQVVPVIKALRVHASQIAELEIQRTLSNVKEPDKKTAQSVKAMGNAIVNKMLHPVLTRLKQEGAHGDPQPLIDALVALFELDLAAHDVVEKEEAASSDNVVQFPQRDQG